MFNKGNKGPRFKLLGNITHLRLTAQKFCIITTTSSRRYGWDVKMSVDRHCDKCNLEVPHGTVLTTLCVDGMAHHLVDNISAVQPGNCLILWSPLCYIAYFTYLYFICVWWILLDDIFLLLHLLVWIYKNTFTCLDIFIIYYLN